jgi:peptidoglycan/LPS O-acetylase OafA/YrhL
MFHIGINGGTWSLTVEMFLYLLFPYILIVTRNPSKLVGLGIILAAIVSFNVMIEKSDTVYANPVFRISDFLCGVGFYFACHRIKKHSLMIPLTLLLIIASVVYLGSGSYQYMRGHFVTAPLFGLWIAAMSTSQSLIYRNKILQYLGLISYSFYLWQFAAIELGRQIIKSNPDLSIHLIVLIVFIANVIISAISYHLLEENARKFILRKFNLT